MKLQITLLAGLFGLLAVFAPQTQAQEESSRIDYSTYIAPVPADTHPERELLQVQAAEGDSMANYLLGRSHFYGLHGPKDVDAAIPYFEAAAHQGHAESHIHLFSIRKYNAGEDADSRETLSPEALVHDRLAREILDLPDEANPTYPPYAEFSDKKSPHALHMRGMGIWRTWETDMERLRSDPSKDTVTIKIPVPSLIRPYELRIEYDPTGLRETALGYLRAAAKRGNPDSQEFLGMTLLEGPEGQNIHEGLLWLERAAQQGRLDSVRLAGLLRYTGDRGIPRHFAKAEQWLAEAAKRGDTNSQYQYGKFLADGYGRSFPEVKSRKPEALQWYLRAGLQGHKGAQLALGYLFVGVDPEFGVSRDEIESYAWLNLVPDAQLENSLNSLSWLDLDPDGQLSRSEARYSLKKMVDIEDGRIVKPFRFKPGIQIRQITEHMTRHILSQEDLSSAQNRSEEILEHIRRDGGRTVHSVY